MTNKGILHHEKKMIFKVERNSNRDEALIDIEGHIVPLKNGGSVPHNEFMSEFTKWLEGKGWGFTGFSVQVDFDGETIDDIDKNRG